MFTIYDLNFNPVPLPVDRWGFGLRALDLEISSLAEEVTEQSIAGVPGRIATGFRDTDREMSIRVRLKVETPDEYRRKRDMVYSFFKRLGSFYVAETQQEFKVIGVRVVESFRLERPDNIRTFATANIPLKIIDQPYWISMFRSLDIPAVVAFDLGIDDGRLEYVHSNKSSFGIFNGGTVPLKTIQEKDNCLITIDIKQAVTNFRIFDATGRHFEYNPSRKSEWAIPAGNRIILNGHSITLNETPILNRTNRYFFNLLPGDNPFRVEGLSTYSIAFDFRYKFD